MGTPQPPADPGVYISSSQMYQEVRGLATTMTRVENKLDSLCDDTRDLRVALADHETRLRNLERSKWPLPAVGALTGIAGAVAAAVALLQH